MQRIYNVYTLAQLDIYADDIRSGIDAILESAHKYGRDIRTQDEIWEELLEHVRIIPHARFLLALEDGELVAWMCAKIYVDGKRRNGCITWAWARSGSLVSRQMIEQAEDYFRERGCQRSYLGRSFLQPSFTRLMHRYGYEMASVVYEKQLNEVEHVDSVGPAGREIGEDVGERETVAGPDDEGAATGTDAGGPTEPGDGRTDGPAAEHGDLGPDAAGGVELPANDAGAPAGGNGLSGSAPIGSEPAVRLGHAGSGSHGNGTGGSESGLDPGSGSESGGTADEGTARASGS